MNADNDTLESMIADETVYHGPATQLWSRALDQAGTAARPSPAPRGIKFPFTRAGALAATLCIGVGLALTVLPQFGRARASGRVAAMSEGDGVRTLQRRVDSEEAHAPAGFVRAHSGATPPPAQAPSELGLQERSVIRKAAIDLKSPDVRAAYAKAAQLINEGAGEFIEDASFSGDGAGATAQLTLRVTAQRLGDVLMKLGSLGTVTSQNTAGEDVTDQVVDIDARLRNEQRVEAELLELLAKRNDSSLKEVLELREQIASVRERIERLTAQRDRLGRLTALATIVVVIHADATPSPSPVTSKWEKFNSDLAAAWENGLWSLSRSLTGLVELAVSGLFVWIVLIIVAIGLKFAWVAAARNAASEAPPRP